MLFRVYLLPIVSLFGLIANVINIRVFSHQKVSLSLSLIQFWPTSSTQTDFLSCDILHDDSIRSTSRGNSWNVMGKLIEFSARSTLCQNALEHL